MDTGGRIRAAHMHAANGYDSVALLPHRPWWGRRLHTVLTNNGYRGRFA